METHWERFISKMGLIREPEGVDFIVESKPLTEKDRNEISKFIRQWKSDNKKPNKSSRTKTANA